MDVAARESRSEKRVETRLPKVMDPTPQLRALRLTFQDWAARNWPKLSKSTFRVAFVGPDDLAYAMMETVASISTTSGGGFEVMFKNGDRAVVDGEWEELTWKTAALCGLDPRGHSERGPADIRLSDATLTAGSRAAERGRTLARGSDEPQPASTSFEKRGFGDLK